MCGLCMLGVPNAGARCICCCCGGGVATCLSASGAGVRVGVCRFGFPFAGWLGVLVTFNPIICFNAIVRSCPPGTAGFPCGLAMPFGGGWVEGNELECGRSRCGVFGACSFSRSAAMDIPEACEALAGAGETGFPVARVGMVGRDVVSVRA